VVVDDRVRVVVADAGRGVHPVPLALGAIAGCAVPGPAEARVAADVHVQQIAGAGPLVTIGLPARRARPTRDTVAEEHLPDRLMRMPGRARDQPRPPTRRLADGADPRLDVGAQTTRLAMRAT
jgi:hypothetical protein